MRFLLYTEDIQICFPEENSGMEWDFTNFEEYRMHFVEGIQDKQQLKKNFHQAGKIQKLGAKLARLGQNCSKCAQIK